MVDTDYIIQKDVPTGNARVSYDDNKGCLIKMTMTDSTVRTFHLKVSEGGQDVTKFLKPEDQKDVGSVITTLFDASVDELSTDHHSKYIISGTLSNAQLIVT